MLLATVLLLMLPDASVHGAVRAAGSREPVPSAVVQITELGRSAHVDARGYYVLAGVRPGRWRVRATAPGYADAEREVVVPSSGTVVADFDLAPRPVEIQGLEVRAREGTPAAAEAGPGAVRLDRELLHAMPAFAEVDVLRALQSLPSVGTASDFSSALYVRGGSPDQTLVLLDGVPLFNPYHLGGLFAAIDPDAVASVDLLPGALPARVGDRLSGLVDIRTRDGGRDRVRGSGSVGLISARAGVDGPLPGGRGSYLVSVRRTYLDLFTDAAYALGIISYSVPYAFTDAHLKLTHDVGRLGTLTTSVYLDDEGLHLPERMELGDELDWKWGSRAAGLTYRQPFGPGLLGEIRVAASTFGGEFTSRPRFGPGAGAAQQGVPPRTLDARTHFRDLVAGADLAWYRPTHQLRGGVQLDSYLFDHDVVVTHSSLRDFFPPFTREDRPRTVSAYVEDEWRPHGALRLRAGLRALHASGIGTEWMPRLGARIGVGPALGISLGGGRYVQALHSIKDEESVFSSLMAYDFLARVPAEIGLSTGEDLTGGVDWARGATSVRVDAYVRRLDGLPLPPLSSDPLLAPVLAPDGVRRGSGSARGVEVLAQHTGTRAGATLAYALSSAERRTGGERFPPRFERRHRLDLAAYTRLGKAGKGSARVIWATGQPFTPAIGKVQTPRYDPHTGGFVRDEESVVFGEHNGARLPGYFRLDLAARKSLDRRWFGRNTTVTPYVQVLNALNTRNVLFAEPDPSGAAGRPELEFAPQVPFLPTVGLEWRF